MKISTAGFSDFDAQLLNRQLKIVTGHTATDWEYAGELVHDADVLLVRSMSAAVRNLIQHFDGIVATTGDGYDELKEHALQMEWPIRVFSLLALLDCAEAELHSRAGARPVCEQLAGLQENVWLAINGWPLLIRGRDGLLLGMGGCFEQALEAFMRDGAALMPQLRHDDMPEHPVVWRSSLRRLIWSLALHEGTDATWNWPSDRAYHISSYPHFEEWEVTPQFLRLAALFTRQHETLEAAAARTRQDISGVRAFLYACQQCQLGLDSQVAQEEQRLQRQTISDGLLGMLGQLRSRLGLSFRS